MSDAVNTSVLREGDIVLLEHPKTGEVGESAVLRIEAKRDGLAVTFEGWWPLRDDDEEFVSSRPKRRPWFPILPWA
jgi:hypothetical protein